MGIERPEDGKLGGIRKIWVIEFELVKNNEIKEGELFCH